MSGYIISYQEKYKGYMFHISNHRLRTIEISNARFLANDEVNKCG